MAVKVITGPTTYPVTLEEAKAHLRVDFCDDDQLILQLIASATDWTERFTGRALVDQTLDFIFDAFPAAGDTIEIPRPPLIEIDSFWANDNGTETEITEYSVDAASEPARLYLGSSGSWPTVDTGHNAGRLRYRAGYVQPDDPSPGAIPPAIHAAILMYVGTLYRFRETLDHDAIIPVPTAEMLLRQYRVEKAMA